MEIKGLFYFFGSLMRWPVQNIKEFLLFHLYILGLYLVTYLTRSLSINASSFIFTIGAMTPLMIAIYKGLPLDCLDYKASIEREFAA